MGCSGEKALKGDSSQYNIELYTLKSQDSRFVYKLQKRTSVKIIKKEDSNILDDINNNDNEEINSLTSDEKFEYNSIFLLCLTNNEVFKNYHEIIELKPFNITSLIKVIIIVIYESTQNGIEKELIKKGIEQLENFPNGVIDIEAMKEKYDVSQNPNITNDNLNLSDDDDSDDDELIIEEEVTEKTLSDCNKLLFENDFSEKLNLNDEDDIVCKNKIIKIIFENCKFNDIYTFSLLIGNLEKYQNLKKFGFNNNLIPSNFEGWNSISQLINNNYNIRILDLRASSLNDYNFENISQSIFDKRIRLLDISENFLTLDSMKNLSLFLKNNKTLKKLYVQRNAVAQFKAEGVKYVCEGLSNHPNLIVLDISYMELTGCGVYLGQFIAQNNILQDLNVANCKLNVHDFKNICRPICNSKSLKIFDISFNDMGGKNSLIELGEAIKKNKSLVEIHLDQMNLDMDNYNIIFDSIEINQNIKYYSLSYNNNLSPKLVLKFFLQKNGVDTLEYIPYNPDTHPGKELTLEEKKIVEKFKTDKPKMKLITK